MICAPESVAWWSKIFCGGDARPETAQRKTEVSVTVPIVVSETHFQNTMSALLACSFTKGILHIMQMIGLGIRVCQLRINFRLAKGFASHLEATNEDIMLASMTRNFDDLAKFDGSSALM
jgi:hypothetical protein